MEIEKFVEKVLLGIAEGVNSAGGNCQSARIGDVQINGPAAVSSGKSPLQMVSFDLLVCESKNGGVKVISTHSVPVEQKIAGSRLKFDVPIEFQRDDRV